MAAAGSCTSTWILTILKTHHGNTTWHSIDLTYVELTGLSDKELKIPLESLSPDTRRDLVGHYQKRLW